MWWRASDSARQRAGGTWCVPGLASDENLAGVHDAAGQAGGVNGAQRRAELDYVCPDQGLWEQARVLPGWRGFVLTCTWAKKLLFTTSAIKYHQVLWHSFHFSCKCESGPCRAPELFSHQLIAK